jgi:ABC-2 type transport system ATP-binding protein
LKARLGATVIVVGHPDAASTVRAAAALATLGTVSVDRDAPRLQLTVDDGARAMVQVVRFLDDVQLPPTTLALREPSLDDVFLSLTGHGADAAPGTVAVAR